MLADYFEAWARDPELCYRVRGDSRDQRPRHAGRPAQAVARTGHRLAANDRLLAYRVAKVEKLHTLAERLMEVHRQRDEIQRLRRAGEFDQARAQLGEGARLHR